jgi:hypothetical protein
MVGSSSISAAALSNLRSIRVACILTAGGSSGSKARWLVVEWDEQIRRGSQSVSYVHEDPNDLILSYIST